MNYAAKVDNRNALLDKLKEKQTGQTVAPIDKTIDIYDQETKDLRYNISDYYLFSKHTYQLKLIYRTLVWEVLGIISGIVCFAVPFYTYGYGIANSSGKTEDLFTVYFAAY